MYKLLNDPLVQKKKGRFNQRDLKLIWHDPYYENMHAELLRLMLNFRLCYGIKGTKEYIVPELLVRNQPNYEWDTEDNIIVRYTYEFMPRGIITQFIVAMHPWIVRQDWVWREGVILEKDQAMAEIVENYGMREIKIRVSGSRKREFMIVVLYEIDRINASYSRLKYRKLVPCDCELCKGNQEPYFYPYDTLLKFFEDRHYEIQCHNSYTTVNVGKLIANVGGRKDQRLGHRRFRVALSFPGENREFVEQVAGFLADEFGESDVFYDKNFEAELARLDLDIYLQGIYHDDSELVVVFLCAEYEEKEWCGLEWRAIRDLIKRRKASDIMPVRFDNTHIPGLFSIDGYVSVGDRTAHEVAELIIERYRMNQQNRDR